MENYNFGTNVIYFVGILILYYIKYKYIILYIMYYKKRQQRTQEGQCLKNALNLVLIADSESTQKIRADAHRNH